MSPMPRETTYGASTDSLLVFNGLVVTLSLCITVVPRCLQSGSGSHWARCGMNCMNMKSFLMKMTSRQAGKRGVIPAHTSHTH